ncbi:hypothetical protein M9434_001353 [Picochlorum sp. BPE23]|nr:hypothetical protein M9434_001353 [Picochlorum sp. BPE23]
MTHRGWNPRLTWGCQDVESLFVQCLGRDRLANISKSISLPPLTTCIRVNTNLTTREEVLERLSKELYSEGNERQDHEQYDVYPHPELPMAIMIRGHGPHVVDYSDLEGREVIVGRMAGESMLKGAHCYAPGVLATTHGLAQGDTVAVSVAVEKDPSKGQYGVTRNSILPPDVPLDDERFPDRKNMFLGVGVLACSRKEIVTSGRGLAVRMVDRVFSLPSLGSDFMKGDIMVQNLPSVIAAATLDPTPGSRVLDMCAAPGGKTTAMAEIMQNRGCIYALDRSHTKVKGIEKVAEDFGAGIIRAIKADATKCVAEKGQVLSISNGRVARQDMTPGERRVVERRARARELHGLPPKKETFAAVLESGFEEASFDSVLLDGPCTALGLRPRLLLQTTIEDLKKTASYQRILIHNAVKLVKQGGYLVYSTCTINPLENECNVRYILDTFPEMQLVRSKYHLGGPGLTGSVTVGDSTYSLLQKEEADMVQRFDPGGDLDTMGFFIAKFKKRDKILSS